jgi:hypothetical protein
MVRPATDGLDLAAKQQELTALRAELRELQHVVCPANDIATRVHAYVQDLRSKAAPLLRGYGLGQTLDVRWPGGPDANRRNGSGFSDIDGNALLLFALLQPDSLHAAVLRAVAHTQPMAKADLDNRKDELTHQIDELSYVVADREGEAPDQLIGRMARAGRANT